MREAADEIEHLRKSVNDNNNNDMLKAFKAVEKWWLTDGMKKLESEPHAIVAVRAAIAEAKRMYEFRRAANEFCD